MCLYSLLRFRNSLDLCARFILPLFSIIFSIRDFISFLDLFLVIFCSSENEDRARMAAALDQYRLATVPHTASPKEIRQYLKTQFKACPQKQGRFRDQNLLWTSAGTVDKEKYVSQVNFPISSPMDLLLLAFLFCTITIK